MPYRYERICTASTRAELSDALTYMEREHYYTNLYFGARCYRGEVGPPQAKGRGQRWFDEVQDPDQLWLPFEKYTPVKVLGTYAHLHSEYGDGWIITYQNYNGRYLELAYHVNQTEGPNCIVTLSLYRQVEVRPQREDPSTPFSESYIHSLRQCRPQRDSLSLVHPIPRTLAELLAGRYVRARLERAVSDMHEIQQLVTLAPGTGIFYNGQDDEVAHVLRCADRPGDGRLDFHLAIHTHPESAFEVSINCDHQDLERIRCR